MNTKANIIIIEDEKNICNFIETVPVSYTHLDVYKRQPWFPDLRRTHWASPTKVPR